MIKYFGENHTTTDYEEFEDVFVALKNNEIDYGILPIENSCTGAIVTVYDLLVKYERLAEGLKLGLENDKVIFKALREGHINGESELQDKKMDKYFYENSMKSFDLTN